jgi:hypothetical protein
MDKTSISGKNHELNHRVGIKKSVLGKWTQEVEIRITKKLSPKIIR